MLQNAQLQRLIDVKKNVSSFFFCQEKNLRFTFVILRTIQVEKYWITYCGLSLVDMNCSVLTSVSVDMLIIAELFVKKMIHKLNYS